MSERTRELLRSFISEELLIGDDVTVADDDELLTDGLLDSLGVIRLVGYIETELGVRIPPEQVVVENFQTVGVLADHIEKLPGSPSR